ncbi:MAG TPA: hypothetical protein EYQ18_05505, partial [Candidatus Handelsmanbacteria bacterium]|nr:hypothetical protein [Candidatus Handelsmanbacteria bacterium]
MSSMRNNFCMLMLAFTIGTGSTVFAQPIFENQTPVGFSPSDSTRQSRFPIDSDITVLVDLNEAANAEYPVIGNFQKVEQAVPTFSTAETSAAASQAIAIDANGVIHRAWIQRRGIVDVNVPTSSPVYGVVYAKSFDGGRSFTDTVSVSGTMRFDLLTPSQVMNAANKGSSGFSTVELVVDSKGNPRVTYAMDFSADDTDDGSATGNPSQQQAEGLTSSARSFDGIFFNYSNDGGSSWLPSNSAVTVNDTTTVGTGTWPGRKTSFPRMAITTTDDIFIVYQRANSNLPQADIMLAKMDSDSLQLGSAQPVRFGSLGTPGSLGGVRIDPDASMGVTPDIAVGDGDVLHIVWADPVTENIQHKTIPAEDWNDVSISGLDAAAAGAQIATFDADFSINLGMQGSSLMAGDVGDQDNAVHLFPTVVVDRESTPDRIYVLWKHTDATAVLPGNDENILYNTYDYDGQIAGDGVWGTTQPVFSTGTSISANYYASGGGPLFQNGTRHQIQDDWVYVDRVSAVVDDRIPGVRGDLHIVFSAGPTAHSAVAASPMPLLDGESVNQLYYTRYNGTEWELPQVVASSKNTNDGVLARHGNLFGADISMRSGDDNVYMTFVGGSIRGQSAFAAGRTGAISGLNSDEASGFGYRSLKNGSISPGNYFKVIGRAITYDDRSNPVGAHNYHLTYNPVNPHTVAVANNAITITAGDNQDGSGIGGATPGTSKAPGGFLTGQWRNVTLSTLGITSLSPGTTGAVFKGAVSQNQATNNVGVWEGQVNDSGSSGFGEWGDNGDKNGLLVKLNVLGSDSSTNVAVIGSSSSSRSAPIVAGERGTLPSQSLSVNHSLVAVAAMIGFEKYTFVSGTKSPSQAATALHATTLLQHVVPMGSYFIITPDIDITAANVAPSVSVLSPDANTIGTGAFANETFSIQYTLFDSDDNAADTDSDTLRAALYAYPDNGLSTVQDIKTFATLIVDERDISTATTRVATDPAATGDFAEGSSSGNSQIYAWDNPGTALQAAFGWAPITKTLDSNYYIYIIGDDGVNPAVFAVSSGALRVRHIPIVRSVAPVAADTVDTGEYSNLAKANPYKLKFTVVDYDDNAQMRLFLSTSSSLAATAVTVTGTFPNQALALAGATEIQLSDTLRTDEDIDFYFDVTAQGSARDSVIVQGNYFIYAVAADEDTFALGVSSNSLAIRHSPAFEFTAPLTDVNISLDPSQQDRFTIEWQR